MGDFNKDINKTLNLIKKAQQKQGGKEGKQSSSADVQKAPADKKNPPPDKKNPPPVQEVKDNYVFTPYGKTVTPPVHKNHEPKKQKIVTIKTPPQEGAAKIKNKTITKVKTIAKRRSCWGTLLSIVLSFAMGFSLVFFVFPLFMDIEDGCFVRRPPSTVSNNLIPGREANPIRPIDDRELKPLSTIGYENRYDLSIQIRELWLLLYCGNYRPDFRPQYTEYILDDLVRAYRYARIILDRYILNSYGPFQRIRVINEFLTHRVAYDEDLFLSQFDPSHPYYGQDISNDPSFFLTGALIYQRSVCYGFSQAFKLMAAIEGIDARIVYGDILIDNFPVPHAWNKVELSPLRWYNVDVTSNILHLDIGGIGGILGQPISRIFHHGFFLVSDQSIINAGHAFEIVDGIEQRGPEARHDFDFHAQQRLFVDRDFYMLVTSVEEFNEIFDHIRSNRRGAYGIHHIELQLCTSIFGGFDRNPDAYFNMFTSTFNRVRANFDISLANPIILPRNTFLFLIYNPIF